MNEDGGKGLRQLGDRVLRGGRRSPRDKPIRTNESRPRCGKTVSRGEAVHDPVRVELEALEARRRGTGRLEPAGRIRTCEQHERSSKQIDGRDPLPPLLNPDMRRARTWPSV